jgi:hypothetical protein
MKAELFVIIFFALFVGAYFTYEKHKSGGNNESTIVISNGNYYEEIKYSGKIEFSDDEISVKSISPGGHIDFRQNDKKIIAESNKEGMISYRISDGDNKLPLDSNGKKFITEMVKEMISLGIDARERMERIYKNGGNRALINELANLKNDDVKRMYFEYILKSDSLSYIDLNVLTKKISSSFGSDNDKEQILKKITTERLNDSVIAYSYMQVVESFNDDYTKTYALKSIIAAPSAKELFPQIMKIISGFRDENEKTKLLKDIINKDWLNEEQINQVIDETGNFTDDMQKENLLVQLISKSSVPEKHFDKLLEQVSHLRDDNQKQNLFRKLIEKNNLSEQQWVAVINEVTNINGDFEKGNFLIWISQKLPKNENLKNAYIKAAKTINDDGQYGKALRAVE